MDKYINAEQLKQTVETSMDMQDLYLPSHFIDVINGIPAADVAPVRRGRWEALDRDCRGYAITYECSSCKQLITLPYPMKWMDYDYCPNCGARMEVE